MFFFFFCLFDCTKSVETVYQYSPFILTFLDHLILTSAAEDVVIPKVSFSLMLFS